jgi:hypothetical protein
MASLASLIVDLPLPDRILSPNAHVHWREKAKATSGARKLAWYWFQRVKPKTWAHSPIVLTILYRYGGGQDGYRPRDVQNAIASLKPHIDGMVDAGIVPDDSHKWVQWGSVQLIKCSKGDTPGVRISVTRVQA